MVALIRLKNYVIISHAYTRDGFIQEFEVRKRDEKPFFGKMHCCLEIEGVFSREHAEDQVSYEKGFGMNCEFQIYIYIYFCNQW